jgi:Matrixin
MRRNLLLESLERRQLMANYGNPWPEGSRLTFSFAPDTTDLVGNPSRLFQTLNDGRMNSVWQGQIARALQKWAVHTDLNVGLRLDQGQAFGVNGFSIGDPRFGDIRIGAHVMDPGVLAISVPYDPARAGTLTGDILLNSDFSFDGDPYDLMTVMLHEAGHVFGLDHSTDPASPMFARANNPIADLTAGDIAAIRALYGQRPLDRFDQQGSNDTFGDARPIESPNGYDGSTPLALFGDLTTASDVDYFKFTTPSDDNGYVGPITVQLRTAGISLAQASISVLTDAGVVIATDVSTITFQASADDNQFVIRIDSESADEFAIGRYAVAVSFDTRNVVSQPTIEQVLLGPHEQADAATLRSLFLNAQGVFLFPDGATNDSIGQATSIPFSNDRRVETIGSVESTTDRDVYRIVMPAAGTWTMNLWTTDSRGLAPALRILNAGGAVMSPRLLANGNQMVVVQTDGVASGAELYLEVSGARTGNYFLSVDQATPVSQLDTFAAGPSRVNGVARMDRLYVGESQLMHLLLSVAPHADSTARLFVQLINEAGEVVFNLWARQGESASRGSILLRPGEYQVRYLSTGTRPAPNGRIGPNTRTSISEARLPVVSIPAGPTLNFSLQGSTLSGPIGPAVRNPLLRPRFRHPTIPDAFIFPGTPLTLDTYRWIQSVV